ncbi:MAG TPA: hypothetical protein VNP20_11335 [Nocardioidaceae bacterium]|nr:hypothetical protein [Nocardioidaceae bacterium]
MGEQRFPFRFVRSYQLAALPFGVTPATSGVTVAEDELRVRFGLWSLRTPVHNVADVEQTGAFSFVRTAGPPHLSFADLGVTFATNGDQALCVRFTEPVRVLDPTGRVLRHPAATLTVADPAALASALQGGAKRPGG